MNQDFGLSLTPANARRLQRFQDIFNLELDSTLNELAQQDMITEDCFDQFVCPYNETKRAITQFLLDCNLRGIVQQDFHPEFSETEVLNTVKIKNPKHISIFTYRSALWQKAAKSLFIHRNIHYFKHFQMSGEEIDGLREGVLIIDLDIDFDYVHINKLRDFGNEFPQTILYLSIKDETNRRTPSWIHLARALFPTMPHPLYPKLVKGVPNAWQDIPLALFATFYNMCLFPEYITKESIIELMSDDNPEYHKITVS